MNVCSPFCVRTTKDDKARAENFCLTCKLLLPSNCSVKEKKLLCIESKKLLLKATEFVVRLNFFFFSGNA